MRHSSVMETRKQYAVFVSGGERRHMRHSPFMETRKQCALFVSGGERGQLEALVCDRDS